MAPTLEEQRRSWHERISNAFENEYDPLDTVEECVEWMRKTYARDDVDSGLIELLEEVTRRCKEDPLIKESSQSLNLWILFAGEADKPELVFQFLLANNIGKGYAPLYIEYATVLARAGRREEAQAVYDKGIKHRAKPTKHLESSYITFKNATAVPRSIHAVDPSRSNGQSKAHRLRRNPLINYPGYSIPDLTPNLPPTNPYRHLASARPAKRPEKFHFDLKLLLTDEGQEYCNHEARARSMGLLGKKWPPLPQTVRVDFNDDGRTPAKVRRVVHDEGDDTMAMERSQGGVVYNEPTMTMNTKEAMADVFGMYNSPDKTMKMKIPGSKHAPTKPVPITPGIRLPDPAQTPLPAFRPMVENTRTPATFNLGENSRAPSVPFTPFGNENTLAKPTPSFTPFRDAGDVFSAPSIRDAHSPTPPSREPIPVFQAREDVRTPFQTRSVFSHPSGGSVTPAFKPLMDAASPPREAQDTLTPLWSPQGEPVQPDPEEEHQGYSSEEEEDDYEEQYSEQMLSHIPDMEHHDQGDGYDEEGGSYSAEEEEQVQEQEAPLGGRFGQFSIMTPITERTFEYTTDSRGTSTPNERKMLFGQHDAENAAEQLAEELRYETELSMARKQEGRIELSYEEQSESSSMLTTMGDKPGNLLDSMVSSSFKPENPCNAFDADILQTLLSLVPADSQVYDLHHLDAGLLAPLEKHIKRTRKMSGNTTGVVDLKALYRLTLGGDRLFEVYDKLGEGGFGAVVAAKDLTGRPPRNPDEDDDEVGLDDDDEEVIPIYAIKIVKPRNLWEYHVLRRVHAVLPPTVRRSVVTPHALYAYNDESYLILDHCSQGTLLVLVNNANLVGVSQKGACFDELLAMFFTIELLRLIESMHREGLIHGDLKADNCLLRLDDVPGSASAWSNTYSPTGEGGWSYKGVKVIDFGRAIDTRMFPADQTFIADWPSDARDCLEIREKRPWTYQNDYFGLAGIVHCMLFGKYIDNAYAAVGSGSESSQRYRLTTPLKRYWQEDLWARLFDLLLNPTLARKDGVLPLCDELGGLREEMEVWLQANCNRAGSTLKGLLKRIELAAQA